jgi:outer membrane protein TolC
VSFDEAELAPDSSMPAAAQETPAAESGEHGAGPNPMNGSTGTAPSTGVPSSLAYDDPSGLSLESVIGSVYRSFPLLQAALFARTIALGEQVAASGEFDLKLKGASENGPLGFYETYRHSVGLVQPTYFGGEVFAGYRIGRGEFQPWYLERETNDGGEFKAGVGLPLLQDVDIDPRRAALWQAQYGRFLVEPEIQAQLIAFVQEASYVYWAWVAAGANDRIANRVLLLAEDRTDRIRAQVEAGFIDPPELTDNLRLVAERRGKLADAQRKLQQSAAKLSLYWRDVDGRPLFPSPGSVPQFPELSAAVPETVEVDIQLALQNRPELAVIDWQRRQLEVEHAQAENTALPDLDVVVSGSQDVGRPTSPKRDKSQFELEAGLFLDVPLQRRKARGKMTALEGKLAQLLAKRQMVADKIVVDVQSAAFALAAALEQVKQAREAVRLAEDLAERERLNLEQGLSDLLKVTLREQYAAEAAEKEVAALLQYFLALADYRAALGMDRQP